MVQGMEDWLCKREKPSASQPRHCEASALGFASLSRALGGQKAAADTSWGSCYQSSGDNSSHIVVTETPRLLGMCGCHALLWCCLLAWWHLWKRDGFQQNDEMEEKGHDYVCSPSALWVLCPGSLLGTDLSTGCLPHFLGKEGIPGTFHEVPWHRQASDTGWGLHHAESLLSPGPSAVLESDTGKSLPGFIYKENKKKSQPQCCTMGSMEKTLPWANWIFELIFSVLFVFKIVHVQASGPGHWTSWAIQPPALLRTFFWVYKKSLLKQYTMISINRKGIPLP